MFVPRVIRDTGTMLAIAGWLLVAKRVIRFIWNHR